MWTNASLPPVVGWMKPKPLVVLKNFTVPSVILSSFKGEFRGRHARRRRSVLLRRSRTGEPGRLTARDGSEAYGAPDDTFAAVFQDGPFTLAARAASRRGGD